jgi:hypothetical protein
LPMSISPHLGVAIVFGGKPSVVGGSSVMMTVPKAASWVSLSSYETYEFPCEALNYACNVNNNKAAQAKLHMQLL